MENTYLDQYLKRHALIPKEELEREERRGKVLSKKILPYTALDVERVGEQKLSEFAKTLRRLLDELYAYSFAAGGKFGSRQLKEELKNRSELIDWISGREGINVLFLKAERTKKELTPLQVIEVRNGKRLRTVVLGLQQEQGQERMFVGVAVEPGKSGSGVEAKKRAPGVFEYRGDKAETLEKAILAALGGGGVLALQLAGFSQVK